jgi:RimJ/RimL family protein N-acetyltransferase
MTTTPVTLRRLDPDRDAPALHAILGDEACCRLMPGPASASVAETCRLLTKWTAGTEDTSWAIVEHDDGPAVGRITLMARGERIFEVGVMVSPVVHGRGHATAALAQVFDIAFENLGARRLYADIDPDNAACIRLFEKLGFQREGYHRATWTTHIGVRDSVFMALIDSDPRPWR